MVPRLTHRINARRDTSGAVLDTPVMVDDMFECDRCRGPLEYQVETNSAYASEHTSEVYALCRECFSDFSWLMENFVAKYSVEIETIIEGREKGV